MPAGGESREMSSVGTGSARWTESGRRPVVWSSAHGETLAAAAAWSLEWP